LIKLLTTSDKETEEIGFYLGRVLKKGDIVCFTGGLGVGKTVFIKGITSAHGVVEPATSPTFTLINEYKGDIPVYHFDVYRISDVDEMYDIGFEEYLFGDGIVLIEWADLIKDILPSNIIWIFIDKLPKYEEDTVNSRLINIDFKQNIYSEQNKQQVQDTSQDIEKTFLNIIKSKGKQVVIN